MHRRQAESCRLLRPQPDQPLDIATGTGLAARACLRITHAPQRIVGIDVSHGMLQAAAAVSTSSYLQADAARLLPTGYVRCAALHRRYSLLS